MQTLTVIAIIQLSSTEYVALGSGQELPLNESAASARADTRARCEHKHGVAAIGENNIVCCIAIHAARASHLHYSASFVGFCPSS